MNTNDIDKMSDEEYSNEYGYDEEWQISDNELNNRNNINNKAIIPLEQTQAVETEIIEDSELVSNSEQNNSIEKIYKDANLQQIKDEIKIHNTHRTESINIQFSNQRTYEKDLGKKISKERARNDIANIEHEKYKKLEENSKNLMLEINDDKGICLCKNKKTYYYRVNSDMDFDNGSKNDANDYITSAMGDPTKIVTHQEIINKEVVTNDKIHTYILDYHIPVIEEEVFNPKEDEIFIDNGLIYKNLFKHTKYLKKRLSVKEDH